MTTQLKKEKEHILKFKNIICPNYGLECIEAWGSGSKNKRKNSDADITAKITDIERFKKIPNLPKNLLVKNEITISLKTEGGNFTIANGGTSITSSIFESMNLGDIAKKEFKKRNSLIREIQKELGKDKRWIHIGNNKKSKIKEIWVEWFYMLFHVRKYQQSLYNWLNSRQSDLKCVGLSLFVPEKKVLLEDPIIDIIGDNTVIVGDYKLRLKSSGGKVSSSWKINYEINQ